MRRETHPPLTQKEKVHIALKGAGSKGVRSDTLIAEHIPRAAARVLELKAEGIEISSVREKQFVRYRMVGSSAGSPAESCMRAPRDDGPLAEAASVASSQPSPKAEGASQGQGAPSQLFELTPYQAGWGAT